MTGDQDHLTREQLDAIGDRALDIGDCTCFHTCREGGAEGCELSGGFHAHTDDPCPLHPHAPASGIVPRMSPGGWTPIGTAIHTRLPDDVLAQVDALAKAEGVKRAEMIRRLLVEALAARGVKGLTGQP